MLFFQRSLQFKQNSYFLKYFDFGWLSLLLIKLLGDLKSLVNFSQKTSISLTAYQLDGGMKRYDGMAARVTQSGGLQDKGFVYSAGWFRCYGSRLRHRPGSWIF